MPAGPITAVVAKPPKSSPLLRSAMETLDHGLWHFLRSETSTDMKFALLHVDQAIELLLKEKVRSAGKSIYKNPKETISIWGAYDILEKELGCKIPEKADLELLHEERNNIQHKYANPNSQDAAFHVEKAVAFIRRFLKDELGVRIEDHVSSEHLAQIT
jgi:HEPN domain-containing protein